MTARGDAGAALRRRVRERMAAEGIPHGTDDPLLLALGASPLPDEATSASAGEARWIVAEAGAAIRADRIVAVEPLLRGRMGEAGSWRVEVVVDFGSSATMRWTWRRFDDRHDAEVAALILAGVLAGVLAVGRLDDVRGTPIAGDP